MDARYPMCQRVHMEYLSLPPQQQAQPAGERTECLDQAWQQTGVSDGDSGKQEQ